MNNQFGTDHSLRNRMAKYGAIGAVIAIPVPFIGPIIGAVLMVLALVLLSEITQAWLLYMGLVFTFMVMYPPERAV